MSMDEVFEITDFTDVTDWEKFISNIEEVLLSWGLHALSLDEENINTKTWKKKSSTVCFAGYPFTIVYDWLAGVPSSTELSLRPWEDLMKKEDDFSSLGLHPIFRHYGLTEFVTIFPEGGQSVLNESRIKLLMSSIRIALQNTKCHVPVFIRVYQKWQDCYAGVYLNNHMRTDFDVIHLKQIPSSCSYLSGFVDMFKAKIESPISEPVNVSIRFTYSLTDGMPWKWPEEELNVDNLISHFKIEDVMSFPFGAVIDPVEKVTLFCLWLHLTEDSVVESEIYSDLNPLQAPVWKVQVSYKEAVVGRLSESLQTFLKICRQRDTVKKLLGTTYKPNPSSDEKDYGEALLLLTDKLRVSTRIANKIPIPAVTTMVQRHQQRRDEEPLDDTIVSSLIFFIFPDADVTFKEKFCYSTEKVEQLLSTVDKMNVEHLDVLRSLRSSPIDSITWRISQVLFYLIHSTTDLAPMAYVWQEIVSEFRYRYLHGHLLPGLSDDGPSPAHSLFHQKLQMLNCCIKRRKQREEELLSETEASKMESKSVDSDEEFYDALEDQDLLKTEGRKEKHMNLKLLKTQEPLYVPLTQEMPPMTDDVIEEHTSNLLELGEDAHSSQIRAKLMSIILKADMEAFKAANPNSIFEDFIRWHSPTDWISDAESEYGGKLSPRMLIENNTWIETWRNCHAVPARRQRRIFDDTKEAEKILDFFYALTPGEVFTLLLPTLFHAVFLRVLQESPAGVSKLPSALSKIASDLSRVSPTSLENLDCFEAILQLFTWSEDALSRVSSLYQKFNTPTYTLPCESLQKLIDGAALQINGPNNDFGRVVKQLFQSALMEQDGAMVPGSTPADEVFGKCEEREYILRAHISRPTLNSSPGPQRMYCSLKANEVRICGAFTEDTCFM
ncbi:rab3 GTPase-activating protein catalytic subunit-like isoform X2 [Artemia franciscana]